MANNVNNKIGCSAGKTTIIDPNNFDGHDSSSNISVPLEDLNISVVLRTFRKGRTVLTDDGDKNTRESSKTVEINFIEGSDINGKKSLTTKFTDLTIVGDSEFNDETLGITSIDVDFNSSLILILLMLEVVLFSKMKKTYLEITQTINTLYSFNYLTHYSN